MSKKFRDWLFLAFLFLFIIMSIITSLFASGYRFNLSWPLRFDQLLQKTGTLVIATSPKNAFIFLDDRLQKQTAFSLMKKDYISTPAKIKNLLPGEYFLRLEKENYWPLERKIKIESGQTTFAENINLFLTDLPILIQASTSSLISLSADKDYLYLQNSGKIVDLKSGLESPLSATSEARPYWLGNGGRLFTNGLIIDLNRGTSLDIAAAIGSDISDWQYSSSDDRIYYSRPGSISRLETDNKTSKIIAQGENYLTYEPRNDKIFFVVISDGKIWLRGQTIDGGERAGELELPNAGNYQFCTGNEKYLCLYDNNNATLYLINPNNWNDAAIIKNAKNWSWINDNELIYNDAWEISIFKLNSNSSNLITRFSEPISEVIWNKDGNYFIFSTDTSIHIGDSKNAETITIFKTEKVGPMVLDEKNNLLYFYAKINQQEGIHKLQLQ